MPSSLSFVRSLSLLLTVAVAAERVDAQFVSPKPVASQSAARNVPVRAISRLGAQASIEQPGDAETRRARASSAATRNVQLRNAHARSPADTAAAHDRLRGAINDFQGKWRSKWEKAEMKRHPAIDLIRIRGYNLLSNGTTSDESSDVGDRERNNLTSDTRRYYSLLCFINTPKESEIKDAVWRAFNGLWPIITSKAAIANAAQASKGSSHKGDAPGPDPKPAGANGTMSAAYIEYFGVSEATPRQIIPRPNTGSVCPSWIPPDENTPLDEGEAIDLALPIKERPAIRAERNKLLGILDAAQMEYPEDNWITGQRVRFAFDQADPKRTLAAANDCRGDESWCLLLKGFALQQAENFFESENAFRKAEAVAPASAIKDLLCGNAETYMLLNHDDVDDIEKKTCADQRKVFDNVWWLADPLWAVPGNERYIAHNARKLHATLRAVTDRDERYVWQDVAGGDAMREMVVRYGWPSYTYWPGRKLEEEMSKYREHGRFQNFYSAPPYTAKEYTPDRTALIPSGKALFDPFLLNDDAWNLYPKTKSVDEWWPQEHYYYPTHLGTLRKGQDIMWRRDSTINYQMAIDDPLQKLDPSSTALSKAVLMGGYSPTDTRTLTQSAVGAGYTLRWSTDIASAPIVMSAEVLPRTMTEQALRRRYAVHPPPTLREMKNGDVALSQPVLMRMPNRTMSVPVDQQGVSRYMAGDLTFVRDEPIALYWESYGIAPGDTVDVELKFRQDTPMNILQRIFGGIGIGGDRDSVSIRWREPDPRHAAVLLTGAKPIIGRSVAVDLNALAGGTYVVIIEMRKGKTVSARSERRIVVKKRE